MAKKLPPMHPGEVLRQEFLNPLGLSAGALAKACGLPRTRIERIANETMGISADSALRLAKAPNTSVQFWLGLQAQYDVEVAKLAIGNQLDSVRRVNETA
jgi:addiction module HigA family antidote